MVNNCFTSQMQGRNRNQLKKLINDIPGTLKFVQQNFERGQNKFFNINYNNRDSLLHKKDPANNGHFSDRIRKALKMYISI